MRGKILAMIKSLVFIISVILITGVFVTATAQVTQRISVNEAKARTASGKALLVCAYDDNYCSNLMLPGAIKKSQFESRINSLPKDAEIIFYCA